jgi:chromosome segregation and condensation protein ScpB
MILKSILATILLLNSTGLYSASLMARLEEVRKENAQKALSQSYKDKDKKTKQSLTPNTPSQTAAPEGQKKS